ncbi:RNA polymerase sigma factor (sigma-70 family) [Streptacidiphilus sp. MAP12-16]|uniref:RNA polymerase sigma factor n=1 Tax=Streptacidiphilus sp. MAP12-16 TaxID=3156300 RepID=UPI0035185B7A
MDVDEELMTRSTRDPLAFEPLVDRHSAILHAYLARRCGPAADDLLSAVWLAAYERRADYDAGLGPVRGWLFGIARNHVLAHWRRVAPTAAAAGYPQDNDEGGGWDAVDARLDAAALGPALRAALRELPQVERELLLLTAWEQLTPAEAAHVAGIPAGTARSRLHRARSRMQQMLSARHGTDRAGQPVPTSK